MPPGPDGEMVMNPIPGEAGTDYPVFTEGSGCLAEPSAVIREKPFSSSFKLQSSETLYKPSPLAPSARYRVQLRPAAIPAWYLHGHWGRLPGTS